jgi:hypothetical protein
MPAPGVARMTAAPDTDWWTTFVREREFIGPSEALLDDTLSQPHDSGAWFST